jgi:hypothetical protein
MTAVYRTYLEIGDLIPNLVFTVLLSWFPLGSVFIANALACLIIAVVAWRSLPRSM